MTGHEDHLDEIRQSISDGHVVVGANVIVTADELTLNADSDQLAALIESKVKQSVDSLRASLQSVIDTRLQKAADLMRAEVKAKLTR